VRAPMMILAALLVAACAKEGDQDATSDSTTPASPAAGAAAGDPDRGTGGSGVPAGYAGRVDQASANIADAKYTRQGEMWDVQTGPHHIMWAPADSARGNFTASTRVQQVEAPGHREAFGIFVGGSNLDQPTQKYSYFVVAGTGEYLLNTRDGDKVTKVRDWTASPSVPKQDAGGKADYNLAVRVAGDSVHFMVNNTQVAALPKAQFPTDGIAGIRIGHTLHVQVQPVTISG
jgi:hypothetical protein